jgi:hypothetical protein
MGPPEMPVSGVTQTKTRVLRIAAPVRQGSKAPPKHKGIFEPNINISQAFAPCQAGASTLENIN